MSRRVEPALAARFRGHLARQALVPPDGALVVAVSGGLDSGVLLHLLRFGTAVSPERLRVAHFDHRLRSGSPGDARWVRGLARAWGLEIEVGEAREPPPDEASARSMRYAFLDAMRARHAAAAVLTAHHADDQAETVLFRALRGTGVRGLRGIAPRSRLRIRPLLPFWREELEAYAEAVGLSWRDDSTNVALDRARNVLRHVVLPRCEADVAPGARRALVRLARHAAADQEAWEAVERTLLAGVLEEASPDRIRLARAALLAYDPAVRALLLRACARRLGVDLPEAGTRVAMEFTSRGGSGRMIRLPGRLVLARSFERLELARGSGEPAVTHAYEALRVEDPSAGTGEAIVGGRRLRVHWGPRGARGPLTEGFDPGALRFPLRLRGWRPGDRMRLRYGTKKVAKLMAEARVPLEERHRVAVLADGDGRALWVPGVARSADAVPVPGHGEFYIGVEDADSS